jgi:hypothetical protein
MQNSKFSAKLDNIHNSVDRTAESLKETISFLFLTVDTLITVATKLDEAYPAVRQYTAAVLATLVMFVTYIVGALYDHLRSQESLVDLVVGDYQWFTEKTIELTELTQQSLIEKKGQVEVWVKKKFTYTR